MINGGEVIILIAYATKDNEGIFTFPDIQVYNQEIYNRNKEMYNAQILAFRNDCENMTEEEKGSILESEIASLKEDNKLIMLAIDELANLVLSEKEGEEQ